MIKVEAKAFHPDSVWYTVNPCCGTWYRALAEASKAGYLRHVRATDVNTGEMRVLVYMPSDDPEYLMPQWQVVEGTAPQKQLF